MLQQATNRRNFARWPHALALAAALALLCVRGAPAADAPAGEHSHEATGTLRARYSDFDLLLIPVQTGQGSAGRATRVESRGGTATVAPGSYHLLEWRVHAEDSAGRHWRAQGNAWPDPILVPPGGDVQLPLASPLRAYLSDTETNGQFHFHLEYAGPFGERCGVVTVNELSPLPPSLRILDDRGRLLTRLRFDAQHGGSYSAAWKIPDGLTGRFHAVPEPNLGPLRVDVGPGLAFELRASRLVRVPVRIGQPAPDFSLFTSGGQTIQLGFLRPRPVLLCFFCNCGLCRAVATELARASELRKQMQVVVVASDTHVLEEAFRRETGLEALYLNDDPPVVAPQYDSEACPRCWLVDEQGVVRYVNEERQVPANALVTQLRAALAAPRPRPKPQELATLRLPGGDKGGPRAASHGPRPGGTRGPAPFPHGTRRRPGSPLGEGTLGALPRGASLRGGAPPGMPFSRRSIRYGRSVARGAAPAPPSTGRGTVETDIAAFGLTLVGSGPSITLESHSGRAPLAADRYDVLNWWAERRDAEGRLWRVRGGARHSALTVAPNATARLCFVSPLQAHFIALNNPGEVQFFLYLESSSLGRCSSVTVDGRDAPRPHVEVRDATGAVIADLECSYCCGFKASARWRPPAECAGAPPARGPFTAVPKIDYGPLKVVSDPPRLTLETRPKGDAVSSNP